ncbi:MAG: methyltransferase domain-containing protein [Candidatus Peribacteraceae bacterium]|jgi:SAM-dependent methyltransferase
MRFTFRSYPGRLGFVLESLPKKPIRLLDAGNLGDGESTNERLRRAVEAEGGTYVGLDSNEGLTRKLALPNQVVGDLEHAPFENGSFDTVYAGEIIEHTWTPSMMIRECRRILKPGGLLLLDTPNPYRIGTIMGFLFRRESSMGDNRTLSFHEARNAFSELREKGQVLLQPQHKIFYTPAMLRQLLETHGFVIENIGATSKARGILTRLLLLLFPHTGSHLCVIARKATVEEAFMDVAHAPASDAR